MKKITKEQIKERAGKIYDMDIDPYCEFLALLQLQVEALWEERMKPEPSEPQPPSITAEEIYKKWNIKNEVYITKIEKSLIIDAIRFTMQEMCGG